MPYKLLLTGKNTAIIDTFFNHLGEFEVISCSSRFDDLRRHVELFNPNALVFCMQNEEPNSYKRISELLNRFYSKNLTLIIAGDKSECAEFQRKTMSVAELEMHKPLSPTKIRTALTNFLETLPDNEFSDKFDDFEIKDEEFAAAINTLKNLEAEYAHSEEKKHSDTNLNASEKPYSDNFITNIDDLYDQVPETLMSERQSNIDELIANNTIFTQPQKKHILVIDDDSLMLKVIKDHLHEIYDIATAKGGKVAYKFLEKKHTDLILLDYEMPDEDGPTVFKKIREITGNENTPIIFLTGVADKERVMNVLELKPQGFLLKPVEYDSLIKTIEPFLQ